MDLSHPELVPRRCALRATDERNEEGFRPNIISRSQSDSSFKKPRSSPLLSSFFPVELDPGDVGKCARVSDRAKN